MAIFKLHYHAEILHERERTLACMCARASARQTRTVADNVRISSERRDQAIVCIMYYSMHLYSRRIRCSVFHFSRWAHVRWLFGWCEIALTDNSGQYYVHFGCYLQFSHGKRVGSDFSLFAERACKPGTHS